MPKAWYLAFIVYSYLQFGVSVSGYFLAYSLLNTYDYLNKSIKHIDGTLTGTLDLDQCRPGSNAN